MSETEYVYLDRTRFTVPFPAFQPSPFIKVEIDSMDGVATYELCVTCPHCGKCFVKELDEDTAQKVFLWYRNPESFGRVQDAFPSWTPQDREQFLMSNYCQSCWDELMSPPDEEGSDDGPEDEF